MQKQHATGPQVHVEQASRYTGPSSHLWVIGWRIQNLGHQPLRLLAAHLPHSRFRSGETKLGLLPTMLPGENARVELSVACTQPPGSAVENVFLIVRVLWRERPWRIFARLRVVCDEEGTPETTTEVVTTQPVGFSVQGQDSMR